MRCQRGIAAMQNLPFSEACERNKGPILEVLRDTLAHSSTVLEIGGGTGQHAVHFAQHLPHLTWQPADRAEWLEALTARVAAAQLGNLRPPIELEVGAFAWPAGTFDAVFTANTLHIMSWLQVVQLFDGVGRVLARDRGVLAIYGPFRYGGAYTSESNAAFDASLREHDAASGIRDFEAVDALAQAQGLRLIADHGMPANNQLLHWMR